MKRLWLPLSVAILVLILGILIGVWIKNWPLITLKKEVDVFAGIASVATILVTLLVAYWVTNVLEKRNNENRSEKEIIAKQLGLLYLILEETRNKVKDGQIIYTLAASNIKRLYMNTAAVIVSLIKASLELPENHETLIQGELAYLRDLLTKTIPNDPDLVVNEGIITISANRQILIDGQLDKVRNEVYNLELAINRA
jgi:hypothetical protein